MPDLTGLVAPAPRGGMMGGYYQSLMQELQRQQAQQSIQKLQTENQYLPMLNMLKAQGLQAKSEMDTSHTRLYKNQADAEPDRARAYIENQRANANYRNTQPGLASQKLDMEKKKWDILKDYYARAGLTQLGKSIQEQGNLGKNGGGSNSAPTQGIQPPVDANGNITEPVPVPQAPNGAPQMQLDPAQVKKLQGLYDLKMQKDTTDADARKRNLYATNVEITRSSIDPKIISTYSGAAGKRKLAQDTLLAAAGKAPPEYQEYQSIINTKIPLLTSQVRQFYGDSIQPSVREHLEGLANTSTWKDPNLALKRFNDFSKILDQEMSTYRRALKNTDVYQGKPAEGDVPGNSNQMNNSQAITIGGKSYSQDSIKHTAEMKGITEQQVIDALKKQAGGK
jgi:hypothetical protein